MHIMFASKIQNNFGINLFFFFRSSRNPQIIIGYYQAFASVMIHKTARVKSLSHTFFTVLVPVIYLPHIQYYQIRGDDCYFSRIHLVSASFGLIFYSNFISFHLIQFQDQVFSVQHFERKKKQISLIN